ncbi:MAG: DUF1080 domain-containing protein [Ktedonobacteraceae bacterium]|nr:DUF1080 domain-containing protein [Ktedonobacteraceae bacterium]
MSKQRKYSLAVPVLLLLSSTVVFVVGYLWASMDAMQTTRRSTPTLIPSPSPTPRPLFVDTFVDNSKGWYINDGSGYTRILGTDGLTLAVINHKELTESLPTNATFDDFVLTATFTLRQADENDSVGLYVRGDSNLDHDYRVEVFGDNRYAVSKQFLDSDNNFASTFLAPPTYTTLLKPLGQPNTLAVTMKGASLRLFINNRAVYAVTDTDYTHGQIALFVENGTTSDGVTATFSRVTVYPALS